MEPSSSLVSREGPRVEDYLIDFFRYLKQTTGFRASHFCASKELQQTLESMEFYKTPRQLWTAILNATMKLVAEFPRIEDIDRLISFIVTILISLIKYLLKYFFLRSALHLLGVVGSPIISAVIICIYHFVTWALIPLMNYIRPQVEEYAKFTANQLCIFLKPKIKNN